MIAQFKDNKKDFIQEGGFCKGNFAVGEKKMGFNFQYNKDKHRFIAKGRRGSVGREFPRD